MKMNKLKNREKKEKRNDKPKMQKNGNKRMRTICEKEERKNFLKVLC